MTWLLSRTVGLPIVPGAEEPASVGVADGVATVLSLLVIASLVGVEWLERRPQRIPLPARAGRWVTAVVAFGALVLATPAAMASHDHDGHDHGPDGVDGHAHDHG